VRTLLYCLVLALLPGLSGAFDTPQIESFVRDIVDRHGLDRQWVQEIIAEAELKQSILDAISRPAEKTRPWHEYRLLFINERRINDGVAFWQEHRDILERVADECGIPVGIIVAILGIETHYGTRAGSYRVIDSLSTLAFGYPPRSDFFRGELEQFLLLSREHSIDPLEAVGSYAGAMGAAQFISSSYRKYAVDGSGDGRVDLWQDWRDVIASVANYLHAFGWQRDGPVADVLAIDAETAVSFMSEKLELRHKVADLRRFNVELTGDRDDDLPILLFELENKSGPEYWVGYNNFYVITRYNRSRMYAMAVRELGQAITARVSTQ